MNYLEICKQASARIGYSGNGPSTVINQVGQYKLVVDWVNEAWLAIQGKHTRWKWMWNTFSFDTTPGFDQYDAPDSGQWGIQEWDQKSLTIMETATGVSDESRLSYVPWETFKLYYYGEKVQGRPSTVSETPNGILVLRDVPNAPTGPDSTYTVSGERYTEAKQLEADADVPDMPVEFHDIIVWEAASYGALHLRDTARFNMIQLILHGDPGKGSTGRMGDLRKSQWIDRVRTVTVP